MRGSAFRTSAVVFAMLTAPALAQDGPKLTATEVFHLRSECAALGKKILDSSLVGPALYQSQVSHYEPRTNRCYVELTIQTADPHRFNDHFGRYLYDGQTGELLASTQSKKGVKTAFDKDAGLTNFERRLSEDRQAHGR